MTETYWTANDPQIIPAWVAELTVGEIVLYLGGMALLVVFLGRALRPIRRGIRALDQIAADWGGTPERRDAAGQLVEAARPGVMAQLETLRSQVQNSHGTNLRDDLDGVRDALREHIRIAKEADEKQEQIGEQIQTFLPMLEDLHAKYVSERKGAA